MANSDLRWYIMFVNYEQGLALRDLLVNHGVKNRIAVYNKLSHSVILYSS